MSLIVDESMLLKLGLEGKLIALKLD